MWKIITAVLGGFLVLCCVPSLIVGIVNGPAKKSAHSTTLAAPATTPPKTTPASTPPPAKPSPTTAAPTPPATVAAKPAPTTPAAAPSTRDRAICQFNVNGGTYYLNVTSAQDHDFSACDGGTITDSNLDDLFAIPGVDRRCILPNEATIEFHALVAVYSSNKAADLDAARQFCDQYQGTND